MMRRLRALTLGLLVAAIAGAAAAHDYIVVGSTDPAIPRGQALDGGDKIALAPGRTLTLMHASGDLLRLKGAAGGVLAPRRQSNVAEAERLMVLKTIVSTNQGAPGAARPMRTRAGICPAAADVVTLDAVVQVYRAGCANEATQALEAWLVAHPPTDA